MLPPGTAAGASAFGNTYYAKPDGFGVPCTQAEPCSLADALATAKSGDTVRVDHGTYDIPAAGITTPDSVVVRESTASASESFSAYTP